MPDDAQTWTMIHAERKGLADTIEGLTPEQWGDGAAVLGTRTTALAG
jgi:hypothetical protein